MSEESVSGIRPPKAFNFSAENLSTAWKQWLQQFDWYSIATQLEKKAAAIQAATFMAVIGLDAVPVYLTIEQSKNITTLK